MVAIKYVNIYLCVNKRRVTFFFPFHLFLNRKVGVLFERVDFHQNDTKRRFIIEIRFKKNVSKVPDSCESNVIQPLNESNCVLKLIVVQIFYFFLFSSFIFELLILFYFVLFHLIRSTAVEEEEKKNNGKRLESKGGKGRNR